MSTTVKELSEAIKTATTEIDSCEIDSTGGYIRLTNGLQIAWVEGNATTGNDYNYNRYGVAVTIPWKAAFSEVPKVFANVLGYAPYWICNCAGASAIDVTVSIAGDRVGLTRPCTAFGIGRWK